MKIPRQTVDDSDFRNDLADVIDGIAAKVRRRIELHPDTALDPSLANEKSAIAYEMLAKEIRMG